MVEFSILTLSVVIGWLIGVAVGLAHSVDRVERRVKAIESRLSIKPEEDND